jgi:unsaturated rhamnogalacturonyl hydrolase
METTATLSLAETVFQRFKTETHEHHYSEILALHGLARMATHADAKYLPQAISEIRVFADETIPHVRGSFIFYKMGAHASAWLFHQGFLPGYDSLFQRYADQLLDVHPRHPLGIYGMPFRPGTIWIDIAFIVCPFLLYSGLALKNERWVNEAIFQLTAMRGVLLDGSSGLFHQAVGFSGNGEMSTDTWSGGNGYAAVALCELACELPEFHPMTKVMRAQLNDFLAACVRTQDEDGLWHQEMIDHTSFIETSGSGLILYAMGRAIEKNIAAPGIRESLVKGLRGYLGFISTSGAVDQACTGCLSPGDGSPTAFKEHPWGFNDEHGFGPAILAFSQAHIAGIKEIPGKPTGRDHG